jgi:hypothetical protein
MKRAILAAGACLALVAAGLVHGFWTDRWATAPDTAAAAARLDSVPLVIGEWEGTDKPTQAGPGVVGCVQRFYHSRARNVTVVLMLVVGRPGPIAAHNPEVCYGAGGYAVGQRREVRVGRGARAARFWTADATKTKVADQENLRVYWAFNSGQGWVAPADARSAFLLRHRFPVLHKLYVQRTLAGPEDGGRDEPCEAFLRAALPELEKALFRPGS